MVRRTSSLLAAAVVAAGFVTVLATPVAAIPAPAGPPDVSPAVLEAMQRDLNLSPQAALDRVALDARVSVLDKLLRKQLGDRFGGAYLPDGGSKLVVGVTDAAAADEVRQAGAEPRIVGISERTLDAYKAKLDAAATSAPRGITGWFVDVRTNAVTVVAKPGAVSVARTFAVASGVPANAVTVQASTESPVPYIDVVGGNAYYIGSGSRCSIGFSVNGGFVTAGHCGTTGASTSQPTGTFRGSSFPGNDYAWVQVASGNTPIGAVNNYSGGRVSVAGSQDAAVGASVCRSGSTTGWHCGTIQARNSSVTYPQGTVNGLIRTNVCAEPGDSGGSLLAGSQAQGVTSGGSGNCSSGGTTYFQPVNEILQAYGLTLVTGGGTPPPPGCSSSEFTYTGSLSSGGSAYQPNGSYYYSGSSGAHVGCLDGPSGTDFDLYLQKWNGASWSTVASGTTAADDENVSYNGTAGYYRYRVHAYSGSGTYRLGITNP